MGWTPRQVDACSVWELHAAYDGWRKANTVPDEDGLTPSEFAELADALDATPPRMH